MDRLLETFANGCWSVIAKTFAQLTRCAGCESTVQFKHRCFLSAIKGLNRREVLIADHAFGADRGFGPLGNRVTVTLEPDVGEHPRPAPVTIQERVNRNPPVMESYGLFQKGIPIRFPKGKVVEKALYTQWNLGPFTTKVEVLSPKLARPLPNVSKHMLVQPLRPDEREWCRPGRWPGGQIPHRDLADILRFGTIQLRARGNSLELEARYVERRFAGFEPPVAHSSLQSRRSGPASNSCVVCSIIALIA